jgi:hypothetical protein
MHLQMRTAPKSSPPDVEKLLGRLAEAGVDLAAVGGSNVEFGGELVIVPKDGQEDAAREVLRAFGYPFREIAVADDNGLDLCEVDDRPGGFHACLKAVAQKNLERGRIIRDITVGVPDEGETKIPVHIYSEEIRASANTTSPS